MVVAPSLSESNVYYIFRNNGLQVKVIYEHGKLTAVSGKIYKDCKRLFELALEEMN